MKGFTKFALILSLVFVVLGSVFCMIGLGIGFNFEDFWNDVEDGEFSIGPIGNIPLGFQGNRFGWLDDGEDWDSVSTKHYTFPWQGGTEGEAVDKLELDVYYGTVNIVENSENVEEIKVTVEYRKKGHKREVKAYKDGTALKIEEVGSRRSIRNDSTRITVQIPADMKERNRALNVITIKQNAGDIYVDTPLTAEEINITVKAGECEVSEKLTAYKSFQADVGAGDMELEQVEASRVELTAGVGQISTEEVLADDIYMNCGVGSIEIEAAGTEQDYSYEVKCGVGEVEIGDNSFSGLGNKRKIKNTGSRNIEIDCGVGDVEVYFSED